MLKSGDAKMRAHLILPAERGLAAGWERRWALGLLGKSR